MDVMRNVATEWKNDLGRGTGSSWENLKYPVYPGERRNVAAEADQPMLVAESGAKRSKACLRYDLLPVSFLRRTAKRYTDGAVKYGEGNWQKGLKDPAYIAQFKSHLMEHWLEYLENGNKADDNLAAMAWGIAALMEVERVDQEGRERDKCGTDSGILAGGCEPGDGTGGDESWAVPPESGPSHGYTVGRVWGSGEGGSRSRKATKVRRKKTKPSKQSKK